MTTRRTAAVALAVMAALAPVSLTACSDDAEFDYSSEAQAPDRSAYSDNSEEKPDADQGLVELELDNDARLAIWIDPDDISKVYQQHSDPDDEDAWTEPELLYQAGDGCLNVDADTNGEVVAAILWCYEDDAWIQQAPDQTQTVVTDDLKDWDRESRGEFFARPHVEENGDVTWGE